MTRPLTAAQIAAEPGRIAALKRTKRLEREQGEAFLARWRAGGREAALARYPIARRIPAMTEHMPFPGHRSCAEW